MRKIIFRGKPKSGYNYGNGWLYGSLIQIDENNYGIVELSDISYDENGYIDYSHTPVISETVGQFTGLLDKNGREIYEGDIVSAFSNINKISDPHLSTSDPTYSNKYVEFIRGVFSLSSLEFPNGGCGVLDHYVGAMSKDLEIIGNIHDNPSLLK